MSKLKAVLDQNTALLKSLTKQMDSLKEDAKRARGIQVKDLLEQVSAASNRSRGAVYIIAVISLIVFSKSWNTRDRGWLDERLVIANQVEDWIKANPVKDKTVKDQTAKEKKDKTQRGEDWSAVRKNPDGIRKVYIKEVAKHFNDDSGEIARWRSKIEDQFYSGRYAVQYPFFGVSHDINDLSMFAGFAFFVILLILRFSLARELANLQLAFHTAQERKELGEMYKLLSMGQVFTVPPRTGVHARFLMRNLYKTLIVLPTCIMSWLLWIDLTTFHHGFVLSESNTILGLLVSPAAFVLIAAMTYQCVLLAVQQDRLWKQYSPKREDATTRPAPSSTSPRSDESVPDLMELLLHPNPTVRRVAGQALRRISPNAVDATLALIDAAINDQQLQVRLSAALALVEIGGDAQPAVPVLVDALKDGRWNSLAADALGKLGPKAKDAVPGLIDLIVKNHGNTGLLALEVLNKIDPEAAAKTAVK